MKAPRLLVLAAGGLLLFAIGAGGWFFYTAQQMEKQSANLRAEVAAQNNARIAELRAQSQTTTVPDGPRPFADKAMNEAMPKSYARPESEWKASEKAIYQKLLAAGQFELLIVPFQVQEYALDRATRSLMTAELALAVTQARKISTPDPYLVAEALGDGDRRLDRNEIYNLAAKLGVQKIVWGYVGHDRKNHMALTIQLQERDATGRLNQQTAAITKNFEQIVFTDEQPPIEAYQQLLPEILSTLGGDNTPFAAAKPESAFDAAELSPDPLALVAEPASSTRDAIYFQLLAYLTPRDAERSKERFAEKAYLALLNLSKDSTDYKLLKARSLMLLGLRPAALQVLGQPNTPEELELFAALNGNQPEVEQYAARVKPGVEQLLAKADANFLAGEYNQIGAKQSMTAVADLKLPGKAWPFLAIRAFADHDPWAQFENLPLKQLLDQAFPILDYTAESIIRGTASLGDSEKLQTLANLAVITHVRKLFELEPAKWCCQLGIDHPTAMDYLQLIAAMAEDNLLRRTNFLTQVQGRPEQTLELLRQIESVYQGHPKLSLAGAAAQTYQAKSAEDAEKDKLLKSAYAAAFNAMYWEQGQTKVSADAFDLLSEIRRDDYGYFDNLYASDYPYRPFYPNWEHGGLPEFGIANAEAALRNSTGDITALNSLQWYFTDFQHQDDKYATLIQSIAGRFAGNPVIYQLKAKHSLTQGDVLAAENYYRESIKAQPKSWQAYGDLGMLLIEQGQLAATYKLVMAYPGFKPDSADNAVNISNYAYGIGSKFYWLGEFALAKPLYEIASRLETDSDADLASRTRLKLLAGDYRQALRGSLERARHYNDTYAFRDYLAMLFAMGESKPAWDAFNVLANQFDDPHLWESALVGQRRESKSEAEIAAWVKQRLNQNSGKNGNHAAKHLLRAAVTDRMPTMQFVNSLAEVVQPAWKVNYMGGMVVELSGDGQEQLVLGPQVASEGSSLPIGVFASSPKSQVKSNLVYFAEAYQAMRLESFASAKALLQEAATLYDLSQIDLGYMLPYYAFAAAKSGDVVGVEKYLANFSPQKKGFDYLLAQAVISGLGGKTDESLQLLKSALYKRPFTENRPLQTEYQYAEICKWLYEATGQIKFQAIALDWAKKNQKFQPWFAWAYAMEAIFSDNKAGRNQAIAMALYLDPQSEMLKRIPENEREIAVKEFKGKNPFLKNDSAKNQEAI